MATTNLVQYIVRQGTDSQRKAVTLTSGELGFVTDNFPRLFVGDGLTPGGVPVASKLYWIQNFTNIATLQYVNIGDIVYSLADQRLFALSATPPTLSANYFPIAPKNS